MSCSNLSETLTAVTTGYENELEAHLATICLLDKEHKLRGLIDDENKYFDRTRTIFFDDSERLSRVVGRKRLPILAPYDEAKFGDFFPINKDAIKTVAICPLRHKGNLIGTFNLAGTNNRFTKSKSTDFLEYYCEVVCHCIENVILRSKLEQAVQTDALTMLHNRLYFMDRSKSFLCSSASTSVYGCFMIDIDKFKLINDTYGHPAGDQVIKTIAKTLRDGIDSKNLVCRYGGEEFVALVEGGSVDGLLDLAEKIRRNVAQTTISLPDKKIRVTVSIGAATISNATTGYKIEIDDFIGAADIGLYEAKRSGRNKVVHRDYAGTKA